METNKRQIIKTVNHLITSVLVAVLAYIAISAHPVSIKIQAEMFGNTVCIESQYGNTESTISDSE